MATNFRVTIGKIRLFTFISSPGIPKQIAIYKDADYIVYDAVIYIYSSLLE